MTRVLAPATSPLASFMRDLDGLDGAARAAARRAERMSRLIGEALDTCIRLQGVDWLLRTAGSRIPSLTTGEQTAEFLRTLLWEEVTAEVNEDGAGYGRCRYFRADIPADLGAVEAIALAGELSDEALAAVRLVRGRHGVELQAPTLPQTPTTMVHLIVGSAVAADIEPMPGETTVYTWYPGRVTAPVKLGIATVKLG